MGTDDRKEGLTLTDRDEGLEPVILKELLSEPQGHWNLDKKGKLKKVVDRWERQMGKHEKPQIEREEER